MSALYIAVGKEILRDGRHYADACTEADARVIADALNRYLALTDDHR